MSDTLGYVRAHIALAERLGEYYVNSAPMFKIGDLDIMVQDIVAAAILSKTNTYLLGTRGSGKTLLCEAVQRCVMDEDSLYLRGDKDLSIKDLMIKLNLDGKTQEEIYGIAEANLHRPFFLIDELNRCIGLVQNQFLNIADGYIEIQGRKYYLGRPENGYSLMFATGNPPTNGDYTGVFDEDIALLDRIGLVLNVDDYCLNEDDTAEIRSRGITKASISRGDMKPLVFEASETLSELSSGVSHYAEILSAYLFARFRKMKAGGKEFDKAQVLDWRALIEPGTNAMGDVISYSSDISQRTLQESRLAEAVLFYYGGFRQAEGAAEIENSALIDCYLETLMLKLRYDRRFLPFDYIRENHDGDVRAFLGRVKSSLKSELDPAVLDECAGTNQLAREDIKNGDLESVRKRADYLESELGKKPLVVMTARMLRQRAEKRVRDDRRDAVKLKIAAGG